MTAKLIEDPTYRNRLFAFQDRVQAGRLLSEKLIRYAKNKEKVILLALPAGGIPVGFAVAKKLGVRLGVMVVRKIQIPWNTEAGFGAVAWDGEAVLNEPLVEQLGLTDEEIQESISKTKKTIQERLRKFAGNKPMPALKDKIVILIDDGLASGFTMLAAARSAKKGAPEKIVVAVPTSSAGAINLVEPEVDEIVCLNVRTAPSFAVADAYKNWYDLADEEVIGILEKAEKLP
ncbi:MAG TPA: phosphoribosyltransferase family protein [Candidatus Limnocylindrales bacterium]|nr:phosphoribosyltransferase family protein [Candidatus Limnocylindrales bacterium]